MVTLKKFAGDNAHRIWEGKHLTDSVSKITRLSGFSNFGNKDINTFEADDIYNFLDQLKDEGLADATLNRYTAAISSLFKFAVEKRVVKHVPKVRWKKAKSSRPRYFTTQEVDALVEHFRSSKHPWMADFCLLAVNTGMRLGEILAINNDSSKTYGEISKCCKFITLHDTKNGEERLVPLNKDAQRALQNLNNMPHYYHSHRKFYDAWADAKDELARHDKNFVFHVLRHTCATRLAMEFNVEPITLGKILGHRSMATTAKYVHAQPNSIAAVMANLEKR